MKKLVSATLILCMVISLIPFGTAFAKTQTEEPSLIDAVGITTPASVDPDKNAYNLEAGTTYYVKPRKYISSNTSYSGPLNLTNASVTADVKTYTFPNTLTSSSDGELIGTINFSPNTYKLIKPLDNRKQLYTKDVVVYHYEAYKKLHLPQNDKVALKFTADATVNFPGFTGLYRIFDKNNNLICEGFTTSSITVKQDEALYIDKMSLRPAEIPIYTNGEITFEGPAYYQNFTSNKEFEIVGDSEIIIAGSSEYKAVYPDTQQPVNRIIVWSTSDPDIATVSPTSGIVEAKSLGETYLIARYLDLDSTLIMKKITVRSIGLDNIAFDFVNQGVPAFNDDIMRAVYKDEKKWTKALITKGDDGVCSGMCQTSLLINQGNLDVNDYGADKISEIETLNSRLEYRIAFHQSIQSEFSEEIEFGTGTIKYNKLKNKNKFSEIVEKTKNFYLTGKDPIVLSLHNNTQGAGHAVIPYYVDETNSSYAKVLFYDPNVKYSSYVDPEVGGCRYLKLMKTNGEYNGEWEIRAISGQKDEPRYPRDDVDVEENGEPTIFNTLYGHNVFVTYYPYDAIITTMEKSALYKNNDPEQMELFSTEGETAETSYFNMIRTLKDVTVTNPEGGSATISGYIMTSNIDGIDYLNEFDESPSSYHRFTLPYDRYSVNGETEEDIELILSNDYLITTIDTKDNSEVSFEYADSNANPSIDITPTGESDTFSVENMYFDTDLKYDKLLFTGTQTGTLSIVPEETGFAITGATDLTFTATTSDVPVSVTASEIAEGETIHIVLDGRDITVTDSSSATIASAEMDTRSSTDKPVALLEGGEYTEAQTLTFEEVDDDTVIYYTTDGSTPDEESSIYYGPITIDRSMKVRAKAKKYGYKLSSTVSLTYTLPEVSAPVADISAGYYLSTKKVRLTSDTEGAEIYYTTDGSDPRYNGTLYTFPIDIDTSCTLKTYAKTGTCTSETVEYEYVLDIDGVYLTHSQVVDGVVTATLEQASGKEVTLLAVQYDNSNKMTGVKLHTETLPAGENLVSFDSGLTGDNVYVYVWDGVTPIPVK